MSCGPMRFLAMACWMSSRSLVRSSCTADTFMLTGTRCAPCSRHRLMSRADAVEHELADGNDQAGFLGHFDEALRRYMNPCVGCFQRSSASRPATRREWMSMMGW